MSQRMFLLLLLAVLSGCGALPKPRPQPALYDFGINTGDQETVTARLGLVEAAPSLDGHEMRYRLIYQDPARVFAFTESRWAILPADLIAQRIQSRWNSDSDANCKTNITLDMFEQVFDDPQTSRGVVQLHAELVHINNSHNAPRASTLVKVEKPSVSADAKGGVAALTAATDEAIAQLASWVNNQQCTSTPREN